MTKQIILSHVTVSQSPAVIAKIKNLENIVTKLKAKTSDNTKSNIVQTPTKKYQKKRLAQRTNHADKGNSKTKDVSSKLIDSDSANHENEENNLHFHCIDDLLDYYLNTIRTEGHVRDSNPSPRTISYPVMFTSRDGNVLNDKIRSRYPIILSHIRVPKAGPYHLYLRKLNIRLMKHI